MKYKLISKSFQSMNAAAKYLNSLYDKHDHARCIGWPEGGETGKYTFEVSDNPHSSLIPAVHHRMSVTENQNA